MPELSVIVPIYNVEPYLEKCIKSILAQTFADFELILVNDGSPDKSDVIMKKYADQDNRIINIFQENKGVSAARNAGLAIAKGKYVTFVDPDDYISDSSYKKLIALMDAGAGLAFSNWDSHDESGKVWVHEIKDLKVEMSKKYVLSHYFDMPRPMGGSVWHKVFIKSEIKNGFDENLSIGEDLIFLLLYLVNMTSDKVCFCAEALYHLFVRPNSATRQNADKVSLVLEPKKQAIEIVQLYDKQIFYYAQREFLDTAYSFLVKLKDQKDNKYFKYARKEFEDYMKNSLLSVLRNPTIYWKTKVIYVKKFFIG